MPVSGKWRIRLAAGLANAAGTGFAVPTSSGGSRLDDALRAYTTSRSAPPPRSQRSIPRAPATRRRPSCGAFRSAPLLGAYGAQGIAGSLTANFWGEDDQAETLATGNVSKFSQVISLAARWPHGSDQPAPRQGLE